VKEIQEICVERQIVKDKAGASSRKAKAGASFSKIKAGASSSRIRASAEAEAWEVRGEEEGKKEENGEGSTLPWLLVQRFSQEREQRIRYFFTHKIFERTSLSTFNSLSFLPKP
jgi:hypothetical protein